MKNIITLMIILLIVPLSAEAKANQGFCSGLESQIVATDCFRDDDRLNQDDCYNLVSDYIDFCSVSW